MEFEIPTPTASRQVLMLCKAYPPCVGGVESYSEQLARAYLRRGLNVTVVTQSEGPRGWGHRSYPEGHLHIFDAGSGGQVRTGMRMTWAVFSAARQRGFDFVHATTWRVGLPLGVSARSLPLIVTVHGREVLMVPTFIRPAMRWTLNRAAVVATVSTATLERAHQRLARVNTANWIVASNGLSEFDTRPRERRIGGHGGPVRLLTLARLVERKNIHGALEALGALKASGLENFEYVIAGSGPMRPFLERQVRRSLLTNHVRFVGFVKDEEVPGLYEWADVFLHPQIDLDGGDDFEGFGLSIADAMAFGCLVIAGSASGPADFVRHGVTGLLVDGRSQTQLQLAVRSVLENVAEFAELARSGQRAACTELSWDKHADVIMTALSK